jgi:hypothetical protein
MESQAPQLRPLGIGEILDVAMKIVWRNAGTLLRIVVFIVLPVQIAAAVITVSATSTSKGGLSGNDVAAAVVAAVAAGILTWVGSTLASGACFRAIASAYLGHRTEWRDSFRYAVQRLPSILWVTLLAGLATLLGFILCILPGIYLAIGFALAVPALLTEDVRGGRALGRSRELVRGYWWRVFAVVVLGYLLSGILGGVIQGVVGGISTVNTARDSLVGAIVSIIAGTVSTLVTTPFVAAFVTVLYFDLRVRKEAFDLQLLAERIGVEPPAGLPMPPSSGSGDHDDEEPPFWPPPPGWKPGGGSAE